MLTSEYGHDGWACCVMLYRCGKYAVLWYNNSLLGVDELLIKQKRSLDMVDVGLVRDEIVVVGV